MTLPTMKAGDRVRITVEGEVDQTLAGSVCVILDGGHVITSFEASELTAPTARVEVLPPPVDPDLVLAREELAKHYKAKGLTITAEQTLSGVRDDEQTIIVALAAIKAARAGKAVQG